MKGLSFYIVCSKNKGFKFIEKDGPSIRITLWFISICITLTDIEQVLRNLLNELKNRDVNYQSSANYEETIKTLTDNIDEINAEKVLLIKSKETLLNELNEKIEEVEAENQDLEDVLSDTNKENEEVLSKLSETEQKLKNMESYFCLREEDI